MGHGRDPVIEGDSDRQSLCRVQLFATPWTGSPGSSVHGFLQARIVEWVVIPFSIGSSWPRDQIWVSGIAGSLYHILIDLSLNPNSKGKPFQT